MLKFIRKLFGQSVSSRLDKYINACLIEGITRVSVPVRSKRIEYDDDEAIEFAVSEFDPYHFTRMDSYLFGESEKKLTVKEATTQVY